jgi:hypothetical protein
MLITTNNFFGLDIETTGTTYEHELIQIGLYYSPTAQYVSDVGCRGNFKIDPRAMEVNKFTLQRIFEGKPAFEVDIELCNAIAQIAKEAELPVNALVPCGFNVGAFDMMFVRKMFPKFTNMLGYKTFDLNAAIMFAGIRDNLAFDLLKQDAKNHINDLIKASNGAHDALWDAEQAKHIVDNM